MTKLKMMAAVAGLALASAAAPASAADFVLNLSSTGSGSGAYRNYTFQLDGKTVNARATAWSTNSATSTTVYDANLGVWAEGLGVLNDRETNTGNVHTIDNQDGLDFVLLQFDTAVTLSKLTTSPFQISNSIDSDAYVAWGNASNAWNQSLGLNNTSYNKLAAMLDGNTTLVGDNTKSTRTISGATASNLWLVGAAIGGGPDGKIDGFKLSNVTVSSAVPEPATWMMMIGGFAMVGAAVRRRKGVTTGAAVA
ncbi:PEPxxWA-CTERM sorting domain-containing protein [Sphingomonas sp. RHCKR7]|uniref:PEPxxWA-CTERM sorting domain-containing protein n=1 Tax=Sphingomonas folli TaxID=2862497 RepID=UPI001CA5B17A|nr:PEPxxWA-CTERM sorting domain-containing protein [Sphingomonas folli]MBW6528273.1 PEPxxWA-CTERM sorting domain-containing protein [Sphingomonas folli]